MSECNCCFTKYKKEELTYLETIMMDLCEDCFDNLEQEMIAKKALEELKEIKEAKKE